MEITLDVSRMRIMARTSCSDGSDNLHDLQGRRFEVTTTELIFPRFQKVLRDANDGLAALVAYIPTIYSPFIY